MLHPVQRVALLGALTVGLLTQTASSACAHPAGPGAPYTVTAEDEWGNTLPAFHQSGQTYLLGTYGRRYNLRVHNHSGARVEAVATVDGRDVISGREGDFVNERGYLIEPYDSVLIEGFRTSLTEVAAFRFSSRADSYSARMGTPQNVGVIGVAIFPERPMPAPREPMYLPPRAAPESYWRGQPARSSGAAKSGGASGLGTAAAPAAPPTAMEDSSSEANEAYGDGASDGDDYAHYDRRASRNNLGTEYGEAHSSQVREVSFRRANARRPAQVIVLRYDDEEGLLARGLHVHEPAVVSRAPAGPNPFPHNRFAPPPP